MPKGVGSAREPAQDSPPGVVWHVAQFPMAASSAPFATNSEFKADDFGVSTGSNCGFHIRRAPTNTQTITIISIALTIMRTVIGRSSASASPFFLAQARAIPLANRLQQGFATGEMGNAFQCPRMTHSGHEG